MFMFCLLDRTIQICVSCFRAVKIWFSEYNSLILTTGCSTWHLMAKNSLRIRIVALYKDGLGYKKFGNSLGLIYSIVARVIQRFSNTCFTRNIARVDQRRWVLVLCERCKSCFKKQTLECCQHCFRGCRSGRLSVLRPYTTHCNKSVCMAVVPEGSLFWSWLTKKPANSLLKTSWPRTWINGTMSWSDE